MVSGVIVISYNLSRSANLLAGPSKQKGQVCPGGNMLLAADKYVCKLIISALDRSDPMMTTTGKINGERRLHRSHTCATQNVRAPTMDTGSAYRCMCVYI